MITHHVAYDEIAEFIASMDPGKLVEYHAPASMQNRVDELLEKRQASALTAEEDNELQHYLVVDHLISLAKIRARKILKKTSVNKAA